MMTISYFKIRKLILLSSALLIISACGLKDDLYMPEPDEPQVVGTTLTDEVKQEVPESSDEETPESNVPLNAPPPQ